MTIRPIAAALLCAHAASLLAASQSPASTDELLENVVVTAVHMRSPLEVATDPSQPRQPLPAHDGAEYLKTIPGFNVIRKGGTDGDPLFRGMAASRINILVDGESLLGGCGMRMDPPTAYVFPETFDRISVIKGPQTVSHGPGNSAATVMFERDSKRRDDSGWEARGSLTGASFGRNDEVLHVNGGSPQVYAELSATRAESDDYRDGKGDRVQSAYERWNTTGAIGWTPDADTMLELSGALSDGEAAYADRAMDGAKFERENLGLKFRRDNVSELLQRIEAQAYYNYIDHVMDNYSLRDFTPTMMMPNPTVSNPDRRTTGGKLLAELQLGTSTSATLGIDHQANEHSVRSSMNQTMMPYQQLSRIDDAEFSNVGVFAELTHDLDLRSRLIGGVRVDDWEARDLRETIRIGMMGSMPNPDAGARRHERLPAGFARYEHDLDLSPVTLYAGVGHVERFPDYWETISDKESESSLSAFDTRPEKNTQIDVGLIHKGSRFGSSLSFFYNDIEDYILIESNYRKGMRNAVITRNVDARTWGGEAGLSYAIDSNWNADLTLAYTRGENRTDDHALAQQPPLEGRFSLNYASGDWSFGALLRLVDEQDRIAINQGNVVGQDLGESDGFAVFSLNGGWKPREGIQLTAGVDNLLDANYAEHLSRGGAMVSGFTQTERVNEPGRTAWLKLGFSFD
jgi:iron complex outermembrane recepter protein